MYEQINQSGYQTTNVEDEQDRNLLLDVLGTSALAAGAGAGITAERARRRQKSDGGTYKENFIGAAKDIQNDLVNSLRTITGQSPFDIAEKSGTGSNFRSISDYAETQDASDPFYLYKASKRFDENPSPSYVRNPLTQAAIAARDSFNPSSEDFLSVSREMRRERGESSEGPRSQVALERIPLLDAARDLLPEPLGGFSAEKKEDRFKKGIGLLKNNSAQATGSFLGRAGSDFVNNGVRSLWWLVNAPQAVSDLVSEEVTARANREGLYGVDYFLESEADKRKFIDEYGEPLNTHINTVYYNPKDLKADPQLASRIRQLREAGQTGDRLYSRRRVGNNLSTLLALPSAIAINSGLGLNNPFGGSDGYKAVFPDQEDPTKTSNVLAEVASKYILGRQGDLLPWEEFKKVRPDVSKGDYMSYKGYRYNKNPDYNVFDDGRLNMFNGVVKYNNDALNGPELFFLGKSLPLTTTVIPTAAAIAGAGLGTAIAKYGALNQVGVNEALRRKRIERDIVDGKYDPIDNSSKDSGLNKRGDALKRQIKDLQRRKIFMGRSPVAPVFNKLRNTRAITAGLAGGFAGLTAGNLIGNEFESRRREGKIKEREERGY